MKLINFIPNFILLVLSGLVANAVRVQHTRNSDSEFDLGDLLYPVTKLRINADIGSVHIDKKDTLIVHFYSILLLYLQGL